MDTAKATSYARRVPRVRVEFTLNGTEHQRLPLRTCPPFSQRCCSRCGHATRRRQHTFSLAHPYRAEALAMCLIELNSIEIDDPGFVKVVSIFVNQSVDVSKCSIARVIHIDNWFGDRWLGFWGKVFGAAGMRNRRIDGCVMPSPPFKPSRVVSAREFHRKEDGRYVVVSESISGPHVDKPGDAFRSLIRPGIYAWYSGNTKSNSHGSLMICEVTREGSTGFYIGFERFEAWRPTKARNISLMECERIIRDQIRIDTA